MSSESVRFRPRQGERDSQTHSSAQQVQATIERWAKRIRNVLSKFHTHLAIVVLAVLVFSIGQFDLPLDYQLPLRATPTMAPALGFRGLQSAVSGRGGERTDFEALDMLDAKPSPDATESVRSTPSVRSFMMNALFQAPIMHTEIPDRPRRDVITYVVQAGDTVLKIAIEHKVEQETLMWANAALEKNPDLLRPGQELVILPIDGVYHTVVKGDTLASIAKKYEADVNDIIQCEYNGLDPEAPQIAVGDKLIVPGGVKPYISTFVTAYNGPIPQDAKRGTGLFAWPCTGTITDRFGFATFSGRWHGGLDISGYTGADVKASDSGFVTYAGWSKTGYGNLVVIDHRNGFETRYAHLNTILIQAGQSVGKGQLIALMGSTGNSSGPHLHFEIREQGVRKNPQLYLQ
ncbi:MAG: M23 family metallopeptidase [Anaerolineae bacterium]|nr:M23 family metallopeptidase [Anaerolineae bacterium]